MTRTVFDLPRNWPVLLILSGMLLAVLGALIAAQAVVISSNTARQLAGTFIEANPYLEASLEASLREQSRAAQWGLYLLVAGTLLQIVGTVPQLRQR
jgi:hypothetical protein